MFSSYLEVVPAYGRDYKSQKEVQADWAAGKDFQAVGLGGGGYINKQDADRLGVKVLVRYAKQMKVYQVK